MKKLFLLYVFAGLLVITGLMSFYYAFRKQSIKEKMTKAMLQPPPRSYGNPFLWLFGLLCIALAILILLKTK